MDETDLITQLNEEEAKQYIGGVVFVAIIMVIGFVGNLHVLLVYAFYMKPSNHRIFILVLGVLDLINCTIGMPFTIVDLRKPLTFTMSSACKILRFTNSFICTSSALTLLVIATDRYRKICVPLGRQITQNMAKLLCCIVLFTALLLSWPAPILYGKATVITSNPNITGSRCHTEDKENFTKYQGYFNDVLILVLVVSFIVLDVLYTLMWRVIAKNSSGQKTLNNTVRPGESLLSYKVMTDTVKMTYRTSNSNGNNASEKSNENNSQSQKYVSKEADSGNKTREYETGNDVRKTDTPKVTQRNKSDRGRRTTLMFLVITAVFFLSYVPHLSLKIVSLMQDFVPQLSFTEKVLYNTFVWCFFINNIANCFVYGIFDMRFRSKVSKMYNELFCRA